MLRSSGRKQRSREKFLNPKFEFPKKRVEADAKNIEELAGVMFETFLDDDGSIKDIAHSAEIIYAFRQNQSAMDRPVSIHIGPGRPTRRWSKTL